MSVTVGGCAKLHLSPKGYTIQSLALSLDLYTQYSLVLTSWHKPKYPLLHFSQPVSVLPMTDCLCFLFERFFSVLFLCLAHTCCLTVECSSNLPKASFAAFCQIFLGRWLAKEFCDWDGCTIQKNASDDLDGIFVDIMSWVEMCGGNGAEVTSLNRIGDCNITWSLAKTCSNCNQLAEHVIQKLLFQNTVVFEPLCCLSTGDYIAQVQYMLDEIGEWFWSVKISTNITP